MQNNYRVALIPGDGIGPEIVAEAEKVLRKINEQFGLELHFESALVGGAAIDETDTPLPDDTLDKARKADAILLGAVGGPQWDKRPMASRPEKGLLGLRSNLELFANLRPAILYPQLASASSLKPEVVSGLDIMIVRELTGGIYFGQPRGVRDLESGERQGYNTYAYTESEIRRIGRVAFEAAQQRGKKLCSVDKANVLEVTVLWREIMEDLRRVIPETLPALLAPPIRRVDQILQKHPQRVLIAQHRRARRTTDATQLHEEFVHLAR